MINKPTPAQITQHLQELKDAQLLLDGCNHFMEMHVPNMESYKVHATLRRLSSKVAACRLECITILRGMQE